MDTVGILVFYNGNWVRKDNIESYEGGEAEGIIVSRNVTFSELDGDMNGLVHLQNHICTCRKFDLEQLPCKHAIAVCRHLKLNPYSFASSYYT